MKRIETIILKNADRPARLALILVVPFAAVFAVLIFTFYMWDHRSNHNHLELQLRETAKAHYKQVVLARLWNARHGGVYVEVTEDTPPNPYLDDPEKTITGSNGKQYTKLNPAYMTRQLSEMATDPDAFRINISGLNPKNPANTPDEWETAMIRSFRDGSGEAFGIVRMEGKDYFRYMGPLAIKEECLACHGAEGYKVGDIKGGISVSVPAILLKAEEREYDRRSLVAFGSIGAFAVTFLVGLALYSSKKMGEGLRKELEAKKLEAAVKVSAAAAHELRQPMTIISGFSNLIEDKVARGEDIRQEAEIIIGQCDRMNAIITKMFNVTTYRTKSYDESSEIFDLGVEEEKNDG